MSRYDPDQYGSVIYWPSGSLIQDLRSPGSGSIIQDYGFRILIYNKYLLCSTLKEG